MAGEAIVTIRERQWRVYLATAPGELTTGLAGAASIGPGKGMLFDLGYDTQITVTTVPLLFPIDIAFISSRLIVVDIARNIPPGYLISSDLPARYFLEVNAGELSGAGTGDRVGIEFLPFDMPPDVLSEFVSGLVAFVSAALVMALAVGLTTALARAALASPEREMLPLTEKKKWFERGLEAGRKESWMNVEETLPETLEAYRDVIRDASDLVWTDIEQWEQTDHFNIIYGSKMWKEAEDDIDRYYDLKSEFWEGYLAGRREIGIDIYKTARELLERATGKHEFLPQTSGKKGKVLYVADLTKPSYVEEVELHPETGIAVFRCYGKPVVSFSATEEQKRKIRAKKGRIFIFDWQVIEKAPERVSRVVPVKRRPRREGELEYFADSPEFLAQTIEDIGYRERLDSAFQEAIARAKKEG